MNRTEIINLLIKKFNYKSYLEIGVRRPDKNFDLIECPLKDGVDPDGRCNYPITSDEFFSQLELYTSYGIIFIDGLHEANQVIRDINNSLTHLLVGGIIVVDDCNPPSEAHQKMPRIQSSWTGDVWKAWLYFRSNRPDLEMFVVDATDEYGVGIINYDDKQNLIEFTDDYHIFNQDRVKLLNLISEQEFLKWMEKS